MMRKPHASPHSFAYRDGVDHTGAADEPLRAVLAELRSLADPGDLEWQPLVADARSAIDGAWSTLAEALGTDSAATAVLTMLKSLVRSDQALLYARDTSSRMGEVLRRLELAPCSISALVDMAPRLVSELGFDRAIFSRVVDGVWISESVFVTDDSDWAEEINRAGKEQPQPLVPGLFETEIVRRRRAMMVHDVQQESRVHRPIADASRSTSYVAAPVLSGDRVVGLLHADRYLSGREIDAVDCETLATYVRGLQLAFSRAMAVERLDAVSSAMRFAVNECDEAVSAAHEFSLCANGIVDDSLIPFAPRVTRRAVRSVRELLTVREAEILEEMANGRTNSSIAAKLFISEGTVKQHVKHILRKLGAENRVEAVTMLYQSDGT